ncbi:kappaPI-actitoxin-Avd3c [Musca domestica]|uniref:KappaPI-actitoxin-Avd3c-like n=1 Tax=Musca domestica TaxID=7370 RepID=A0A1I8NL51_MUSDO|nr:kappaPI-actitoxin-Avd3c [Musca domestica]
MKLVAVLLALCLMVLSVAAAKDPACDQPPMEIGQCRATQKRFTYVAKSNECVAFNYGGCRGNDNNFATKSECEKKCKQ